MERWADRLNEKKSAGFYFFLCECVLAMNWQREGDRKVEVERLAKRKSEIIQNGTGSSATILLRVKSAKLYLGRPTCRLREIKLRGLN